MFLFRGFLNGLGLESPALEVGGETGLGGRPFLGSGLHQGNTLHPGRVVGAAPPMLVRNFPNLQLKVLQKENFLVNFS